MAEPARAAARQRLIRLIHVARNELRMDEDTYRQMLTELVGKNSSSAMTVPELDRVLEHLKRKGFKVRSKKAKRPVADDGQSKMIRGIWLELHSMGVVRDPSEKALASFVKRMTGVEALQWLNSQQASKVIEELKQWRQRIKTSSGAKAPSCSSTSPTT